MQVSHAQPNRVFCRTQAASDPTRHRKLTTEPTREAQVIARRFPGKYGFCHSTGRSNAVAGLDADGSPELLSQNREARRSVRDRMRRASFSPSSRAPLGFTSGSADRPVGGEPGARALGRLSTPWCHHRTIALDPKSALNSGPPEIWRTARPYARHRGQCERLAIQTLFRNADRDRKCCDG